MAGGNASCGMNYFCMGAFLIFVGSVLLCALGFTILLPHAATRNWPEVTCQVTNTSYNFMQCMCDQQIYAEDLGCVIKYPCLEIMIRYKVSRSSLKNTSGLKITKYEPLESEATQIVHYSKKNVKEAENQIMNGFSTGKRPSEQSRNKLGTEEKQPEANTIDKLDDGSSDTLGTSEEDVASGNGDPRSTISYTGPAMTSDANLVIGEVNKSTEDDVIWVSTTLFRWWSDAFYGKCSLHECGVEEWNIKAAAKFKSSWGTIGQPYRCFYRPDSPDVVILNKTPTSAVVHAIFWPCICLGGGWLLWLGLCIGCCSIDNGENNLVDQ